MTTSADRPAVSAAVIIKDGHVLLIERRVKEGSLSWQFPAGEVEAGESLEAAAVRETSEEVGLTVVARKLLGERVHPNTGRRMAYVACDIVSGSVHVAAVDEVASLAWVQSSDLKTYVPYGFAPVVEEYLTEQGISAV